MKNNLEDYSKIINKKVRYWIRYVENSLHDGDDLKQEFQLKLMELLSNDKYINLPYEKFKRILSVSLNNKASEIINACSCRQDTSKYSNYMNYVNSEMSENDFLDKISNYDINEVECWEKASDFKNIITIILNRMNDIQINKEGKNLLISYLNINDNDWDLWEELKINNPMYRQFDYPPFITYGKLKGIRATKCVRLIKRIRAVTNDLHQECFNTKGIIMKESIEEKSIKTYQCPGCVNGPYEECYKEALVGIGCEKHSPATYENRIGKFILGMPRGFDRLGTSINGELNTYLKIFINHSQLKKQWDYDMFNVPVWKHLDKNGNTLIRGMMPRVNTPFIHIILGDYRDKINCLEITEKDIKEMS